MSYAGILWPEWIGEGASGMISKFPSGSTMAGRSPKRNMEVFQR